MRRRERLRNSPSDDAIEVTEGFHGRPVEYVEEIIEPEHYRENLAEIGELVEIEVLTPEGDVVPICFEDEGVKIASSPERNQLFLCEGDQSLELEDLEEEFGLDCNPDKLVLGQMVSVTYFTDKHHLEGPKYQKDGTDYMHEFEEPLPTVLYDKLNQKIHIAGGAYEVTDEGIKG